MHASECLLLELLPNIAISVGSYTSIKKFYRLMTFGLLINTVILLLNCPVSICCLNIHFLSHKHCYLSLICFTSSVSHGVPTVFP